MLGAALQWKNGESEDLAMCGNMLGIIGSAQATRESQGRRGAMQVLRQHGLRSLLLIAVVFDPLSRFLARNPI